MAEKEYIERKALIEKLETLLSDLRFIVKYEKQHGSVSDVEKSKAKFETMKGVISLVKSQPTADVQEVRHGKNVTPFHPADEFICSECGIAFNEMSEYIIEDDVYREFYFKFCPNCGAKMDKE